jgi:hypothetical protein
VTTETAPDVLTLQDLRNTAELLERESVALGRLDAAQLDARRPGASATYPRTTPQDWMLYALWLSRACGAGDETIRRRPLTQVVHEALAETPAGVTLRSGLRVEIYAKSLDTLLFCEALDADLAAVHDQLCAAIVAAAGEDGHLAVARFLERLNTRLAFRLYCWILSAPGPGIPFSEHDADPAIPSWTATLHAEDVAALYRAHQQVNRDDLAFIAAQFPPEVSAAKSRLPLSGFLGAMAHEMNLAAREVMRNFTVRGLFAQAIVAAETHRAARARVQPPGRA